MSESTTRAALDRADLKILRLLQADGRLGNAEIARRVNIPVVRAQITPISNRLVEMES